MESADIHKSKIGNKTQSNEDINNTIHFQLGIMNIH